mgnify:CR=1 FL=1
MICSLFITVLFSGLDKPKSALQLPTIHEYSLDNGMRVLISPNYDYPLVYCHLYINSGEIDDPQHGGRLAQNTYWNLFEGTEKYPNGKQIREKIRELGDDGGRFNKRDMAYWYSEIGSYFLREDIESALELYADILQNPILDYITYLERFGIRLSIPFAPKNYFYTKHELLHAHLHDLYRTQKRPIHPRYRFKIKKRDLQNWHRDHIQPERTTLMITGDVNYLYVEKIINDYFSNWSSLTDTRERPADKINENSGIKMRFKINENSGIKMRFVNMKGLHDANIWIGLKPASIHDDWYFPSELAQTVFSGENSGRMATIQERLEGFEKLELDWGNYTIAVKTKYNDLSEYYDFIISEFGKMSQSSISEVELLAAKKIRSINSINKLNKPEDFTRYVQFQYNNNGFSLGKIETSYDEMNSVSLDEVNNAASRIYDPNNFILLLMGNRDSCATFLERFEDVEYYEQEEEVR